MSSFFFLNVVISMFEKIVQFHLFIFNILLSSNFTNVGSVLGKNIN